MNGVNVDTHREPATRLYHAANEGQPDASAEGQHALSACLFYLNMVSVPCFFLVGQGQYV